jgi:hypothetical protein
MSKLWIYGCSFSEPFGLGGKVIVYKDGTRDFYGREYWGTHLANKLNVEVINKALSGMGWNYIVTQIDNDILSWGKKDFIIISPSFFSRATIMEFIEWDIIPKLLDYYKTFTEIAEYNKSRWLAKIKTLQYFGYNVYTWVVDENANDITDLKNLILTPDNDINWKDWMDRHKEFWLDPYNNDWHFNAKGHIEVANRMYNFIKKENNESSI